MVNLRPLSEQETRAPRFLPFFSGTLMRRTSLSHLATKTMSLASRSSGENCSVNTSDRGVIIPSGVSSMHASVCVSSTIAVSVEGSISSLSTRRTCSCQNGAVP